MYITAAICKITSKTPDKLDAGSPWVSGNGIRYSLVCCHYYTWFGNILRQQHSLCKFLTFSTVFIEFAAPCFLLLSDGWGRMSAILILVGMHIGMGMAMHLNNFSPVCIAALTCFIPTVFWGALGEDNGERRTQFASLRACIWLLKSVAGCILVLCTLLVTLVSFYPQFEKHVVFPMQPNEVIKQALSGVLHCDASYLQCAAFLFNLQDRWSMFDNPKRSCGWYVLPAKTKAAFPYYGKIVDAHKLRHSPETDGNLTWSYPVFPAYEHDTPLWDAWYEILYQIGNPSHVFMLNSTARYYCRNFPLEILHIVFSYERYNFSSHATIRRNRTLWMHRCGTGDEGDKGGTGALPSKTRKLMHDTVSREGPLF